MTKKTSKIVQHLAILFCLAVVTDCRCSKEERQSHQFFQPTSAQDSLIVAYTGSVQGSVEPCGCTSDPLGGIARLGFVLAQAKSAFDNRLAFVDAGGLLFDSPKKRLPADLCQDQARVDLLLSSLKAMGLRLTVESGLNEARGEQWAKKAFDEHHIKALANLEIDQITVGKYKLSIVAIRPAETDKLPDLKNRLKEIAASQKRNGADLIIALSQAEASDTKQLFADLEKIDLVVLGKDPGELPIAPVRAGKNGPWIVASGIQGQYLGVLEFHHLSKKAESGLIIDQRELEEQQRIRLLKQRISGLESKLGWQESKEQRDFLVKRLQGAKTELQELQESKNKGKEKLKGPHLVARSIPLSRDISSDEKIAAALASYNKEIPNLVTKCEESIECPKLISGQASFVGAESCKQCHASQYDVWQKAIVKIPGKDQAGNPIERDVGHSRAWATLEEAHKTKDRECIGCHTIGFEQPGGYCKVNDVLFRKNVQCESCHGAGSLHAATGDKTKIRRQVPEAVCRECHKVPHIATTDSFVYDEKVQHVLGAGHGALLLERLKHQAR